MRILLGIRLRTVECCQMSMIGRTVCSPHTNFLPNLNSAHDALLFCGSTLLAYMAAMEDMSDEDKANMENWSCEENMAWGMDLTNGIKCVVVGRI